MPTGFGRCALFPSSCSYESCASLTKTYSCADYYAPGKPFAGWCDLTCGYTPVNPVISVLEVPCNLPGSGCNDTLYPGPPSCGCLLPLPSDDPKYSCKGCILQLTMG